MAIAYLSQSINYLSHGQELVESWQKGGSWQPSDELAVTLPSSVDSQWCSNHSSNALAAIVISQRAF